MSAYADRHGQKLFAITNPAFPKQQILDSFKLKECADDFFKFDKKAESCITVENTVEKGEIARYEQFLLFARCFQKTCTSDT